MMISLLDSRLGSGIETKYFELISLNFYQSNPE